MGKNKVEKVMKKAVRMYAFSCYRNVIDSDHAVSAASKTGMGKDNE